MRSGSIMLVNPSSPRCPPRFRVVQGVADHDRSRGRPLHICGRVARFKGVSLSLEALGDTHQRGVSAVLDLEPDL
jgi:hypothetical protein